MSSVLRAIGGRRGSKQYPSHPSPPMADLSRSYTGAVAADHQQSPGDTILDDDIQTYGMQSNRTTGLMRAIDEGYQTGPGDGYPTPPFSR